MSTETPSTTDPLTELVNAFKAALRPAPTPPSASGSPMALPATFAGEAAECSGFLLQVSLFIQMQPQQFPSDSAKVAFLISLLTGKALQWAKAIWNANNPIINSFEQFMTHFSEVFNTATDTLTTSDQLFRLQQGTSLVNDYTLRFRTLAAASGWNETALLGAYRQGLNLEIRASMALYDDSIGLETFLQRTTRVSQRLATCQSPVTAPQSASVAAYSPVPEPMQVDSTRLSRTERNRRITMGLCIYCGQPGHHIRNCPVRPPRPVVSTIQSDVETTHLTLIPVTLRTADCTLSVSALVDSGSSGNFIAQECLDQLQLSRQRHCHEYAVRTIQGKPLGRGRIRHSTPYITLQVGLFHSERIRFLVLEDSTVSIILGRPWLQQHRPTLRWDPCDVTGWSERCFEYCLSNIPQPLFVPVMLSSTLVESPEPENPPEIPVEYMAFQDVFSKQAATHLPPHRPWDCAIDLLPEAKLTKGKVYPLSIPERQAMEEYIERALKQGFIQPSTSPAASSFFFVGKKDGGLRPCIDYRQLNSQIIQQPYPLPLVPAALEELRGAQVFTKLDLRSAYNLIRIRKGDEWKTAFITPTGHYEYRVMPYGLSISPSVFQTFMNEVFREYLHRFVVVYIDDILIYSRNQAEHRQHVQQVLHKLRQHSLFLKLEKCEFHQSTVQFLGYNISAEGVQMDQGKVNAIQKWPLPNSVKELQRFLGFTNFYRRFIMDYSTITSPLTSLLRGKPKQLIWNPAAHEAFERLKTTFSTAPVLHHPDPEHPFTVEVDAFSIGVGAVLSQAVGDSSVLHPCAAFSRKLSPAEQNYDIGNRELLAIKIGPGRVATLYLREARRLNPRQARWALFLTRFNFTITYRPGSKNVPADALSRQFSPEATSDPETIIPSELIVSPIIWDLDQAIQQATLQEPAPPECPEGKTYVPLSQRQILLGTAHRTPGSGHPGSSKTLSLIQSRYWWPSMHQDTIRYVQNCSVCAKSNSPRQLPTGKLVPLPIPERPWPHLGVDFITDLPESEGNTCVLVVVDRFSKACKLIPLRGLPTAMETAEHLFHQVFRHYGLPEEIVSDRGPQFTSHVWKAFFKLLGITVNLSSGYHPQTNGQTERKIQETLPPWSRFLPWAEYAQNSLRQDTTGLTPFQCVLGYQPPLFPWTEEPSNVPAVDHWFRESERVWDSAHHHPQRAIRRHKSFADARRRVAPHFQPGDLVWLSSRDVRLRLPCCKLSPRYIGPFRILRQINDVTYQLQLPPRYRIHPTFHVSLLKPFSPSVTDTPGAEAEPPPLEVLEQPSVFTVREILDSRRRGGRLEYLIDWDGYGPEERSWVNRDDVLDPLLLLEFHRSHPNRPAPRGRGRPRRRVRASGAAPGGGGNVRHSPQPPPSVTSPTAPPTRSASPEF
ncbi:Transposon Tf2-8 polyprotein [Labeo rohita]|uniref:Gypsy retrotransposon integrase-like protein 1 n=1 Tax=Labeo rohita TaxID=84645 RepID=A0ABQ8L3F8_LABRO|nr:Transposon Tf2-8 polyprotein [Labeo rohita]